MVLTLSTKPCSMSSVYSSASMTNQTRRNGSSISASVQEVRSASSHSPSSLHLLEPLGPVRNMDPASLHGLDTVVPSNVHCHCIPPFTSTGHLPIHTISTTGTTSLSMGRLYYRDRMYSRVTLRLMESTPALSSPPVIQVYIN